MLPLPSFSNVFAALLNLAAQSNTNIDTATIEGRSFVITIDEFPQDIGIKVKNGKVLALDDDEVSLADVTFSGNIKAIINMIKNEETGLDSDELYVTGKISAAKNFQHFLASLAIDWQGFFNQFLPDEMAEKTATFVEQGITVTRGNIEQLSQKLKHYLLEEKKIVLTRQEFSTWRQQVDDLHTRLDLLINQLQNHPEKDG
ncbi:MAG: hypothetical protein CSA44_02015 [Gammaproteobacteria bacterium]|nr:MAG: hypothetical protein CSA44_02015 [Gammaproteobacteria bacterium]